MFTHTYGIMHHNITMTFKHRITAACMCCILGVGTATVSAEPFGDGFAALNRGDYAQAIRILRPLAEQGLAKAQYLIGSMYQKGEGVPQNYQEALKWY